MSYGLCKNVTIESMLIKDTKKTSFYSLPLEVQIHVMKQLNHDDLMKFVESLEKDYRDVIEYLVDDIEYDCSNIAVTHASELSQSKSKPLISLVDIRDITKWISKNLIKRLSNSFNIIKFTGIYDMPGGDLYSKLIRSVGSHSTFEFVNCSTIRISDLILSSPQISFKEINEVFFSACGSSQQLLVKGEGVGTVTLDHCMASFFQKANFNDLSCHSVIILCQHVDESLTHFCVEEVNFNSERIDVDSAFEIRNCVFEGNHFSLNLWSPSNESRPKITNVEAPKVESLALTFSGAFPLISKFSTPMLCHVSLSNLGDVEAIEDNEFSFLEVAKSLRLYNFLNPLMHSSWTILTTLNLQLIMDPVREITAMFPNLKNLTIEFYMDARSIPLIQAISLENLSIINEATNDIDIEGVKALATSFPKLKKFSFFEISLGRTTCTDLTAVILALSAHIEVIELREAGCDFLKNMGMDVLPEFPQLSQLIVTSRCNRDDFNLLFEAKKLSYVYLTLNDRDVSCITVKNFPSLEVFEISSSAVYLVLESVPSLMFLKIDGVLESFRADSLKKLVCMMCDLVSFSVESNESQIKKDIGAMNQMAKIFNNSNTASTEEYYSLYIEYLQRRKEQTMTEDGMSEIDL